MDFSRIMETFDTHGASFVSVTQQFNTTHSMGRLTLNILLSFAQFEREIIGDRLVELRNFGWRTADEDRLIAARLLVPMEPASSVWCPECFDHEEEVVVVPGAGGQTRMFIPCPEHIRVEVRNRDRERWQVSPPWIAVTVSACLGMAGQCVELAPGRLWRLGRTSMRGQSRELLLARGLNWPDAAAVRSRIVRAVKPVVFVATDPPADFWQGKPRPVVSLPDLATLGDDGLDLDPLAVHAAIEAADESAAEQAEPRFEEEQLRTVVRRQIKAERQAELTDDLFVQAYCETGSYRKAADLLTARIGQEVSKDQVARAVARSGGAAEVMRSADSDSVVRAGGNVRDRRGNRLIGATE
jgi:hypothetical protein